MCSLKLTQPPIEPFNVLAFDPGGTTGWAHAISLSTNPSSLEEIEVYAGEFGPKEHYNELHEALIHWAHDASVFEQPVPEIVFEPFHFRQHKDNPRQGLELVSCEYIGVIKLACAQLGVTYYDRFVPGETKRYVTDKKLEMLGWLQTPITPMRHRNDALRQLVKYLIVKKKVQHPITTAWRREDASSSD